MEGKAFGKYHDVIILILGFILTTIVGGYLTNSWQSNSANIQRQKEQANHAIQEATKIFEEISRLMDKRLYRMRRINMGMGSDTKNEEMNKRWDAYRSTLFEWNENLNRNLALIQMYFGQDARNILEHEIQSRYIKFGAMLESARDSNGNSSSYKKRNIVADELNNYIYQFDLILIEKIQNGNVSSHLK